jgi:hypothetical protein
MVTLSTSVLVFSQESVSQHNKFAAVAHLAEIQFLRDAKNWL